MQARLENKRFEGKNSYGKKEMKSVGYMCDGERKKNALFTIA